MDVLTNASNKDDMLNPDHPVHVMINAIVPIYQASNSVSNTWPLNPEKREFWNEWGRGITCEFNEDTWIEAWYHLFKCRTVCKKWNYASIAALSKHFLAFCTFEPRFAHFGIRGVPEELWRKLDRNKEQALLDEQAWNEEIWFDPWGKFVAKRYVNWHKGWTLYKKIGNDQCQGSPGCMVQFFGSVSYFDNSERVRKAYREQYPDGKFKAEWSIW